MGPDESSEKVAIKFLNRGGRWQWIQLALLYLSFLFSAQQAFIIVFVGFQPRFACVDSAIEAYNSSEILDDTCNVFNATTNSSTACLDGFRYDVSDQESIVSEWDLVCDKAYISEVSQLLYTLGMGIGSLIFPLVADRTGRRRTFIVIRLLSLLCSTGIVFAPNIAVFIVLRCIIGFLEPGIGLVRAVYISELSPVKFRPLTTSAVGIVWAASTCLEALIASLMRGQSWRYLYGAISVSAATVFFEIFCLKESLLWLYANGKSQQAMQLLKHAMETNRVKESSLFRTDDKFVESFTPLKMEDRQSSRLDNNTEPFKTKRDGKRISKEMMNSRKLSVIDVMKRKTTRSFVLVISAVWFVNTLVYYGLSYMSSAMTGDRILNFFIVSAVEIPACGGLYIFLRFFGRKTVLIASHGVCAVSLLLAGVINITIDGPARVIASQIVTFSGKFAISATFLLLYYYTAEGLPTNFRTSGLGIGSFWARVGALLAPFSGVLLRLHPWVPGVVFGGLCLLATSLLFSVPETGHRNLPQTIEEIEAWTNDKKNTDV